MSPDNEDDDQAPQGPAEPQDAPDEMPQSDEAATAEQHDATPPPQRRHENAQSMAPEGDEEEAVEDDEQQYEEDAASALRAEDYHEPEEEAPAEIFGGPDAFYQPSAFDREPPPPPPPPPPRPVYTPPPRAAAEQQDEYMFGAPDIPMPKARRPGDKQRLRDALSNLDLDLERIKRRKRFGLFFTAVTVLFVAFVLAPVTWVGAYLFFDPPVNVLMLQRAAEGQPIRHYPVPINRMSPHIVRAVIAAEDANFCTHDGFDVAAIQSAMQRNARGGRVRGASTISQQTAKNLFLWPERSWMRKGLETYFTALIEFMWPKRRIMEAYLNTAEWGGGAFGVEAAARTHFGVSAADLTPLQAARLAAVLPNPNRWRADQPGPYVRARSAMLVGRARVVQGERMAACVLYLDRPDTR